MDTRNQSRDPMSYDFGRSYAFHKAEKFNPRELLLALRDTGVTGGMPYEEALCGAIEELSRRLAIEINYSSSKSEIDG